MKIVFLDRQTLDGPKIDWAELDQHGEVTYYGFTAPTKIVSRAEGAEVIITNKCVIDDAMMSQLPQLRLICVAATGYNNIDIAAANQRDILVANVRNYSTYSVVQHVFAMLLSHRHRVAYYSAGVKQNRWSQSQHFAYTDGPIVNLQGQTMGILGYGTIGKAVARTAHSMGMRVLATKRDLSSPDTPGVELVALPELLAESDVLSLHASGNPTTRHIIDAQALAQMKPTATLINTARGTLVDEEALAHWLREHRGATALLDVLQAEPPAVDHPLFALQNCVITPHQAWIGDRARQILLSGIGNNIAKYRVGELEGIRNV